jgi:hypothetical protein
VSLPGDRNTDQEVTDDMVLFPQPTRGVSRPGHMIVCGDDALAERLAAELTAVYRERVTLVVPAGHRTGPPDRRGPRRCQAGYKPS